MTPEDLIAILRSRGVALVLEHGQLRFRGPGGAYTAELRSLVAEHRTALVALLAAGMPRAGTGPPHASKALQAPSGTAARVRDDALWDRILDEMDGWPAARRSATFARAEHLSRGGLSHDDAFLRAFAEFRGDALIPPAAPVDA